MADLVDDVLKAWRAGERLLAVLPMDDPAIESVAQAVLDLRDMYHHLSGGQGTANLSVEGLAVIRRAQAVIAEAKSVPDRQGLSLDGPEQQTAPAE